MVKAAIGLIVAGVLFSTVYPANSQPDGDFYKRCISERISRCELKAKLVNSRGANTKQCGQEAYDQARFYQRHCEELVQRMLQEGLGSNRSKVDHFLIEAYYETVASGETKIADSK